MVKGMGGAMDLVSGAKRVIITMEHTVKGKHKILEECDLPLTGKGVVDLLITDLAVFEFNKESREMTLIEISPESNLDEVKQSTGCRYNVSPNLKEFQV